MRHLVSAQADRQVQVLGTGTFSVPPPTTRQAIAVMACYQQAGEGRESEKKMLRSVCADWLPLTPFSVLFGEAFPEEERRRHLLSLVWAGISPAVRERFEAAKKEGEPGKEEPSGSTAGNDYWTRQIMRYCHRMGSSYEEAMQVPFPALLGQMVHLGMIRAQDVKDAADAQIIVRSEGGDEAYQALAEQAGGREAQGDPDVPDSGAWSDDPDERKKWKARKMAELQQVKQNMKHRSSSDVPDK